MFCAKLVPQIETRYSFDFYISTCECLFLFFFLPLKGLNILQNGGKHTQACCSTQELIASE